MMTATRQLDIKVCVTDPGVAMVEINGDLYVARDHVREVTFRKFGGETVYTVRVGPKGCYGCNCKAKVYGRPTCRHESAADKFLNEVF